jgi:two-component system response regulator PilR (NtrC family)
MQESTSAELPEKGLEAYLQQQEKQLIVTALQQTGWNKTQAAELLGTTFRSLRYRMKKLGIAEEQTDS